MVNFIGWSKWYLLSADKIQNLKRTPFKKNSLWCILVLTGKQGEFLINKHWYYITLNIMEGISNIAISDIQSSMCPVLQTIDKTFNTYTSE